jgi:hypothetical protein
MTIMVLFPFVVKLGSSGSVRSVAAERQIFFKERLKTDFHVFLRLVAVYRRFDLTQNYGKSVRNGVIWAKFMIRRGKGV